jgi:sterol desaturase/sphingolipid hydroxylase (fatty acid hydroxylase superfamily)
MPARRANAGLLGGAVVLACFAGLAWLERRRPLRRRVQPVLPRTLRNLAMGVLSAATVAAIEAPLAQRAARIGADRDWGLVRRVPLPAGARTALSLVLLDYSLYVWHVLLHRLPLLWSAHRIHHLDRDLDASTALRFHVAELLLSVPWRVGQVIAIGVPGEVLTLWGRLTLLSVMFHHSNLRLTPRAERRLSRWVVTPHLHGIHHSERREEHDRNFSSGLAVWDMLHGTRRDDVPQDCILIGLPLATDENRPEGPPPGRV